METQIQNYVEQRIFSIRGIQIMLDSDLAELFEVETKVFNQTVKRNINRFPLNFRFQLTKEEYELLRSQIVTLKHAQGQHRKYLPFTFTEQGVEMHTGIIRSNVAVDMSIKIMIAFVEMRKLLNSNFILNNRMDTIELRQFTSEKENEEKFEKFFNALSNKNDIPTEKIFYNGQIYDAYSFIVDLIRKANTEIILIDNYVDNSVFNMLTKKKEKVSITVITSKKIDQTELYHFGTSLKDLGKKWFAFSKMDSLVNELLNKLEDL
jgi:hypothetical protein